MKNKKYFFLLLVPFTALVLSGCSKPSSTTQQVQNPLQQSPAEQLPVPSEPQLEPLPDDNKKAIDSEIENIEKDLDSTSSSSQIDISNSDLGL